MQYYDKKFSSYGETMEAAAVAFLKQRAEYHQGRIDAFHVELEKRGMEAIKWAEKAIASEYAKGRFDYTIDGIENNESVDGWRNMVIRIRDRELEMLLESSEFLPRSTNHMANAIAISQGLGAREVLDACNQILAWEE